MKSIVKTLCLMLVAGFTLASCSNDKYTITVQSNNDAWGTTSGSGEYAKGEQVQIAGIPNVGYYFLRWDDGNTSNPRTITVEGDAVYKAIFSDTDPNQGGGGNGGGGNGGGGGGGVDPNDYSINAGFTFNGQTYQGILVMANTPEESYGLLPLHIIIDTDLVEMILSINIVPEVGTQTLSTTSPQSSQVHVSANAMIGDQDYVHTANGDFPHWQTVGGCELTVNVSAIDLNQYTVTLTAQGTMLDIAKAEQGNPEFVPFTAYMTDCWFQYGQQQ